MTSPAGSGVQVSAKRRGYRLTAGVLLVMMLGGGHVQCCVQPVAGLPSMRMS